MLANSQSHILITGGSSGVGYGLAARFADAGATVLVTGRDAARLEAVRQRRPSLRTFVGDIGVPAEREALGIVSPLEKRGISNTKGHPKLGDGEGRSNV